MLPKYTKQKQWKTFVYKKNLYCGQPLNAGLVLTGFRTTQPVYNKLNWHEPIENQNVVNGQPQGAPFPGTKPLLDGNL